MNRIAKGKRVEREVAKFFEELGYLTYRPTWSRWGQKDVFHKFDIVAVFSQQKAKEISRNKRKAREILLAPYLSLGHFSFSWKGIATPKSFPAGTLPSVWFLQVKSYKSDFYKARKEILNWLNIVDMDTSDIAVGVVLRKEKGKYRIWFRKGVHAYEWKVSTA